MNRHARQLVLGFVLIVCIAMPAASQSPQPVEQDASAWKKFAPPGGGFTALAPGTPTEQKRAEDTAIGKLENHIFILETDLAVYMIVYADFPDVISDPTLIKGMLDAGRDRALANVNGKLKSEKNIQLSGYSGRDWLIEMPDGLALRARAYWVNRRLYQLVYIGKVKNLPAPLAKVREDTTATFLDSFALVSETPPASSHLLRGTPLSRLTC